MIYEDIKDSDEKVRLIYTGFPTFQVFWMFFLTLLKHGVEKLNYWEGERRQWGTNNIIKSAIKNQEREDYFDQLMNFYLHA